MDSANSGSLHTSSGADEEYDSRAADSFLPNTHQPLHAPPPPLFDPLSNYTHLHQNPNSLLLNPNISWSGPIRPDPNPSTSHNPMLSPPPFQTPTVGYDTHHHHQLGGGAAARNPKKRSRASRRAPTTVLTTDVTNFRAMVQEFTGIPAQPFNNSSFFGMRSAASEAAPPYHRRTFASNLFSVQNPLINSLLQSNPKFIFSKPDNQFQIPSKNGSSLEEFGDVNASVTALISPDQHVSENDDTKERWRSEGGINGGYVFSATEKRGEGAVESWIN